MTPKPVVYVTFYVIFFALVHLVWSAYERIVFGEIRPDFFRTIVAIYLAISITHNFIKPGGIHS